MMFELTPQMITIVLLAMMFCHVVDDFYLQGLLAQLKQKMWWQNNAPDPLYKNDYKTALIIHGFSWACCIHIPLVFHIIYCGWSFNQTAFLIVFVVDWIIHIIVDDLKANRHLINLTTDQSIHSLQIILTWLIYFKEVG